MESSGRPGSANAKIKEKLHESILTKNEIRDKEAKERSRIDFAEKVLSDHEKSS